MKKIILALCVLSLGLTGCASKPSKDEVKKSFKIVLVKQLGAGQSAEAEAAVKAYSDCVIDESYDKLSAKTLNKFVKADTASEFQDVNGSKSEKEALDKAAEKCSGELLSDK